MEERKLVSIGYYEKEAWKSFCKEHGEDVLKLIREALGFWKYHFTTKRFTDYYILLNLLWQEEKKKHNTWECC